MFRRAAPRRFRRRPTADHAELRNRALAYEAAGERRNAIAAWTALDLLQPDAEIEEHLVDLRCDPANSELPNVGLGREPVAPWPRRLDDPFPEVSDRPPEVTADQLTMEVLGGAILHHGSLLVRGLLSPDRAEHLRATIDRVFAGRAAHVQGAPSEETTPWYVPCARWDAVEPLAANGVRRYNDTCNAVHAADSPSALFEIVDALTSTSVLGAINDYLGETALLSIHKTMLRRVPPDAKPSFHQDGTFMGLNTRAVDIWVALTDCGEGTDAPGLSILPRRLHTSVRPDAARPTMPLTADELAVASAGTQVVRPTCAPGDALLFDELCLHANGGDRPGLTRHRYALEAWFFAPSSMPATYLPILV
jgi:hypothetical protein